MKGFSQLLRSQFYSLRRELRLFFVLLLGICAVSYIGTLMNAGMYIFNEWASERYSVSASMLFGMGASGYADFVLLFVFIAVGIFAVRDFNDKTINYEIANGHGRAGVFLSRAAVSLILGAVSVPVFLGVMLGVSTLQFGWGDSIPVGTALTRVLLLTLLCVRLSAEIVLMAAIFRRTFLVFTVGSMVYIIELIVFMESEGSGYALFSSAASSIMNFKCFALCHLDETNEFFYDNLMTADTAAAVGISYIVVAAACVYIACRLFCRADLD